MKYYFYLIQEKYPLLTDKIIANMNTKDLKLIMQYYRWGNDNTILSQQKYIKLQAKQAHQRVLHTIKQYLNVKNVDKKHS